MIGYTLRRLLLLVPIFLAVSVVIFAIIHIERVAFDQIHVFTLHPEAAIAFANAFGAQSEFD